MALAPVPPPADAEDAQDLDLPEEWSASARETFLAVLEERRDLTAAELAALWQAAALESNADALEAVAREQGLTTAGSQGQTVVHPALQEARHARVQAATILARLTSPLRSGGAMTNSERGRLAARARWGAAR